MFVDELIQRIGQRVEVFTTVNSVSGILTTVTNQSVTVRTNAPGYGGAEDVTILMDSIAYVRFFV